jgi:outer membrane lipoprotein LolB
MFQTVHKIGPSALTRIKTTKHMTNALLIAVLVVVLQSCASKVSLEQQKALNIDQNLASLSTWKLKGKIAWISPTERKSAYINWQQNEKEMAFTLSNVLGITLASLTYDEQLATLTADGETYTDTSPSWLIYRTTGWEVPIVPLSSWIKGAASIDGREYRNNISENTSKVRKQSIKRYENGLIQQLIPACNNCDAWQIDYKNYQNARIDGVDYQLPSNISLTNLQSKAVVKIRISEWYL